MQGGFWEMELNLTDGERAALALLAQAPHIPDMPVEFWHSLAILRARGIVDFRHGHWFANAELRTPSASGGTPAADGIHEAQPAAK